MEINVFDALTIINTIVLAIVPLAFFRRQKLQEIKYKEIMDLNVKTHDITTRIDKSLKSRSEIPREEYERLDHLITRYKKHSGKLSKKIALYKQHWDEVLEPSEEERSMDENTKIKDNLLRETKDIRDMADTLLK